ISLPENVFSVYRNVGRRRLRDRLPILPPDEKISDRVRVLFGFSETLLEVLGQRAQPPLTRLGDEAAAERHSLLEASQRLPQRLLQALVAGGDQRLRRVRVPDPAAETQKVP